MSWRNIAKNARRPGYAGEMLRKVSRRLERNTSVEALEWAQSRVESWQLFCEEADTQLFGETQNFCAHFEAEARPKLDAVGLDLGGGGAYPLLYFLIRLKRPGCVVETGVAAGWTTAAMLEAMDRNGVGELMSSDFPYFRYSNPERLVGLLVSERLHGRWHLDIRGDRVALPQFVNALNNASIGMFHYDSDKSYTGRAFAIETIRRALDTQSIIVMDDIQNNLYFRHLLEREGLEGRVFEFEGKYLGVIGV